MQQLLQHLMSGADILKILMFLGIAAAIPLNIRLGKINEKMTKELETERKRFDEEFMAPNATRRAGRA
ncbi:MAG: hypothetical protein GXD23_15115 [Comamonadaceae bacterium]|jgi:hypothetical protein|uniref:hypothetical protein n=1 Tax=Hydrogenophaga sp. PML113 TaxID=1899350 RepID=UPI0008785F43|nr:hypothetical protein [Hydrogenophaga sp. PML113]NCT98695.1 hypothetical protein [Comamonadaceae bacterium]